MSAVQAWDGSLHTRLPRCDVNFVLKIFWKCWKSFALIQLIYVGGGGVGTWAMATELMMQLSGKCTDQQLARRGRV